MEQPKFVILLLLMLTARGIYGLKCNGLEGLCDLRIDQVTFPGAHNAGSDRHVSGSCIWRNHESNMAEQFSKGIRYFDIDTCWDNDRVKNCHCSKVFGCHHGTDMSITLNSLDSEVCILPSNQDYRNEVNPSDGDNSNEVIILHFNSNSGIRGGETAKEKIGKGLAKMLTDLWDPNGNSELKMNNYYKNNNYQWPTLRQAIESKQRVFVFMDEGPAKYITPQPDWLVQSNGIITSTWSFTLVTSSGGCTSIISRAQSKCDTTESFIELAAFGSFGMCIDAMAKSCSKDEAIGVAMDECYSKREKHSKTVNILSVDYAVDSKGYETLSVVDRARTMNEKNIQKFNL